jgi:small-conductance mechanosensitive channel
VHDDGTNAAGPGPDADEDELQADIERTREELGETLGALSDKLDVKSQVQRRAELAKDAVGEQARELTEQAQKNRGAIIAAVTATAVAIGILVYVRRR